MCGQSPVLMETASARLIVEGQGLYMPHYAGNSSIPEILEVHVEGEGNDSTVEVEVTLNVGDTFEGLAAAFYMDGSQSMDEARLYGSRGFGRLAGLGAKANPVQDAMRVIVPYIAERDATGKCRVVYWATGNSGEQIEHVGELDAETARTAEYSGPRQLGGATYMLPAVRDFVAYINQCIANGEKVQIAYCVVATDGRLHDADDVIRYSQTQLAPAIAEGKFPRTNIVVIGFGRHVDEEQLEELEHEATPEGFPGREIFHAETTDTIGQLPELVAHLITEEAVAFTGGATVVVEATGQVIKTYEGDVPAVLKLEVPVGVRRLVIRAGGQEMPFDIPEEH